MPKRAHEEFGILQDEADIAPELDRVELALISLVERGRADLAQLLKREGLPDAEDGDGEGTPIPGDWTR